MRGTPFPSVTICTEGVDMDAVIEAVTRDFEQWLRETKNQTTADEAYSDQDHRANVKEFLFDFFSISPSYNISIDDIVMAYSSPDPDRYLYKYLSVTKTDLDKCYSFF